MELNEYVRTQADIVSRVVRIILAVFLPFRGIRVSDQTWSAILRNIYPIVDNARTESSRLAREFYDSQRRIHYPDDQRYDIDLAHYEYDWFEEAMRPAKRSFRVIDTSTGGVVQAALRVAKEIENGGRRTILYSLDGDRNRPGWARVATGAETCGFCMMLVSRGPIYNSARGAGVDATDTEALQLLEAEGDAALAELMTRWHPGCDCKVVPVFNRKDWPGRDAYLDARELWNEVTKGYSGKDALNAFRRAIENGQVDPADVAAA